MKQARVHFELELEHSQYFSSNVFPSIPYLNALAHRTGVAGFQVA